MLIRSAHNSMTERFVQNVFKSGLDISMDQWMVLGPIWQLGSPSQKDIGEICLRDKPSITRIIDSLEDKSLVVRVSDQIDHRIKRVILTNAGKQLFYDVLPIMEKTREEVRGQISEEEIEIFKNVLSKIIKNLNS
ncbi:MAG: MarR family winged helix-turn-helix transcriptional regulator [Candidatus Neomarinimicrobiota bacterium]